MSAMPLLAYALYHAYRDRHKVRARRNPYSHADMLARAYTTNIIPTNIIRDNSFASMGQMYATSTNPNVKLRYRNA